MSHRYSDEFSSPPALIMPAEIYAPRQSVGGFACRAKLDTGADLCVFPRTAISVVKVPGFNRWRVRQTGREERSYLVEIVLDGRRYSVEAIAHDRPYLLIGRDVLNQVKLVADGPAETFELIHPAP
jgi:predicted aspartyl protease